MTRSISRHVAWVDTNLPELAHLGQREVDRVIARSERGVMTLRVVLYFLAMLSAQPISRIVANSLDFFTDSRIDSIFVAVCIVPLLLLANPICDKVWRWRIRASAQA